MVRLKFLGRGDVTRCQRRACNKSNHHRRSGSSDRRIVSIPHRGRLYVLALVATYFGDIGSIAIHCHPNNLVESPLRATVARVC